MARSIPSNHAESRRPDVRSRCDYCGADWLRSKLRRDADGLLYCPDEGRGRCRGALDAAVAEASENLPTYEVHEDAVSELVDTTGSLRLSDIAGFE